MFGANTMRGVGYLNIFKRQLSTLLPTVNFSSNEEILLNTLDNVMLISINSPEKRNLLSENGVDKLKEHLNTFENDANVSTAIIHGCGGNFCTGLEANEKSLKKGEELLKVLHQVKKPIIASLHGYTTNFGFQLAIMCDLRVMDEGGLIGFGDKMTRSNVPEEVYERIVHTVGVSSALQISLVNRSWNAKEALTCGLINMAVKFGAALGQALTFAQSMALAPPELLIKEKFRICSQLKK